MRYTGRCQDDFNVQGEADRVHPHRWRHLATAGEVSLAPLFALRVENFRENYEPAAGRRGDPPRPSSP